MLTAAFPQFACAQAASTAAAQADYDRTVDEALSAYEHGRWAEAISLFMHAHQLNPSARTLRGLGLSKHEAHEYADAVRYLSAALTDTRRPLTDKQREEVTATIAHAKLFVGYLKLRLEPPTAAVTINGQPLHVEPDGFAIVDIGWLEIEVSAPDYEPELRRIRINPNDKTEVLVRLTSQKVASATAAAMAPAATPTASAAPVAVDSTAPPDVAPAAATHADRPFETWKWASGGVAVAALGAGAVLLIVQKNKAADYQHKCSQATMPDEGACNRLYASTGSGSALWVGSIASFIAGGALAGLTAVLFALDANTEEERASSLACLPAGGAGVACSLKF